MFQSCTHKDLAAKVHCGAMVRGSTLEDVGPWDGKLLLTVMFWKVLHVDGSSKQ